MRGWVRLGSVVAALGVVLALVPTSAQAGGGTPPGAPTHLTTSNATLTSVDLEWEAPAVTGTSPIRDYAIEYRLVGDQGWTRFTHGATTFPSLTITGLTPGSVYQFRVAAVSTAGTGPWNVETLPIDAGVAATCAVLDDATVACWGSNSSGQLGNSSLVDSVTPVLVSGISGTTPSTSAVSVVRGDSFACALMGDGSVKCWGDNTFGELGAGVSTTFVATPIPVVGVDGSAPGATATALTAGSNSACAVMVDGSAWCWGSNTQGQLGDGSQTTSNVPVPVNDIVGSGNTNSGFSISSIFGSTSALSVDTYANTTCAVMSDGALYCWGSNSSGQLGDGTTNDSSHPIQVSGIDGSWTVFSATAVSVGSGFVCAVIADGSVKCWGGNSSGQLGNGSLTNSNTPFAVSGLDGSTPPTTVVSLAGGLFGMCAVTATGQAKCWGANIQGSLGTGSGMDSLVPADVDGIDGSVSGTFATGVVQGELTACALSEGSLSCWGENGSGQLGDGTTSNAPAPVDADLSSLSVATVAPDRVFAVTRALVPSAPSRVVTSNSTLTSVDVSWTAPVSDGGAAVTDYTLEYRKVGETSWSTVTHTPSSATSQTVTGLSADTSYVFRVAAINWIGAGAWSGDEFTIGSGSTHSCAVMGDGSVKCWGANARGELGDNSTNDSAVPVSVSGINGSTISSTATSVSTGVAVSCALMANGSVECWGDNLKGQMGGGDPTATEQLAPVQVSGLNGASESSSAVSVSVAGSHVCAALVDGTVQCWGWNGDGELGTGSPFNSPVPLQVSTITGSSPSSTAVSVSVSEFSSCAVMSDGTVQCWGSNSYGQLGDGTTNDSSLPVSVSIIDGLSASTTAVRVSMGDLHTCALMADGTVLCWGFNGYGQLGLGHNNGSSVPMPVGRIDGQSASKTAVSLGVGAQYSCAVMADGSVKCWGYGIDGQLGNGSLTARTAPIPVSGIDGSTAALTAVGVASGGSHSCVVMTDGTARCWGYGMQGQLGGGTSANSLVPIQVSNIDGLSSTTSVRASSPFGRTLAVQYVPGAPLRVATFNATSTTLDVAWLAPISSGSKAISDYTIEYRKVGELSWTTFSRAASTATYVIVTGLDSDSTYEFRVAAVNSVGTGPWSARQATLGVGSSHSCVVLGGGTVQCWGDNTSGQLGDNTTNDSAVPVIVNGIDGATPDTAAVTVGTGQALTCSLMAGGTVRCWGENSIGQLGNGSTTSSSVPVLVSGITGRTPSTTAVSLGVGRYHMCSLMADGTVKCWGDNGNGQLGDNSITNSTTPVVVSGIDGLTVASTAVNVSVYGSHSCALIADGTVKCWGFNSYGDLGNNTTTNSSVPVSVSGIDGSSPSLTAVSVSVGFDNSCAVMAKGTVKCWGWNSSGQLGNNSTTNSSTPVAVSGIDGLTAATTAVSVDAGDIHVCAVMVDGSVKCWGGNYAGQLGDTSANDSLVPVLVSGITGGPVASALTVSAGTAHTCALMADGAVKCWGKNDHGQLGDTSTNGSNIPVDVDGFPGVTDATSPLAFSFGRTLGTAPTAPLHVVTSTPTLTSLDVSWTLPVSDGGSPITDYTIEYRKVGASSWTAVSHAVSTATKITVTGLDPDSTYEFRVAAVNINGASAWTRQLTAFAVGFVHTCALVSDGSAVCWGRNNFGQLGNGTTTNARVPGPVTGIDGSTPEKTAVALASGEASSCALLATGAVECWGRNNFGQLGNGTNTNSTTPVAVSRFDGLTPATSAVSISTFGTHVCALRADGSVACWGGNSDGQLGDGTRTVRSSPVAVSGLDGSSADKTAVSITTGSYHSCALLATGAVKCWGNNTFGQLGDGSVTRRLAPTRVSGLTGTPGVVQVSAGRASTCVVLRDGSAKCWGENSDGRLGDGSNTRQLTPVAVSGLDGSTPATTVRSIAVGGTHACANLANGSTVCWGDNTYLQLGGHSGNSNVPVPVTGIDGSATAAAAVLLTTGELHTCAVLRDGSAVCWGAGSYGQLGDGSPNSSAVPVDVTGLNGSTPASSLPWNLGIGSTLVPPPSAPSVPLNVVTSNATTTSLNVSWVAPMSSGSGAITDYLIEYRKVGELSWSPFVHTASAATSATVTGLASDTSYVFRIAAVNSVGTGPWTGPGVTVATGDAHACAVTQAGTVECWGWNYNGQLGKGTLTDSSVPVLVSGITGSSTASTAVNVSDGSAHSCAVMAAGTVQCWGSNFAGQLGDGSAAGSSVPVLVSGITGLSASTTAISADSAGSTSCAVMGDGTVRCWGDNSSGQLGDGTKTRRTSPVVVRGISGLSAASTAVSVAVGGFHACAVMANGTVRCWGSNFSGQLGNDSTTDSSTPVLVSGITGDSDSTKVVSLGVGESHSCAVMADASVKCWGNNADGQVGDGTTIERHVPVLVGGILGGSLATSASSVSAGFDHSCAVMADGTLKCWGANSAGQLGDGTIISRRSAVAVSVITGSSAATTAMSVSTSTYLTCAAMKNGTARCWGTNWAGQLGDGTVIDKSAPVAVTGFTGFTASDRIAISSPLSTGRTLPAPVVPTAPLHVVTSNATSTSLDLSWTAPVFDGRAAITDYTIESRKVGELSWATFTHVASTATSATVTGLDSDSSYVFRVAAVNSVGTGPWSELDSTIDSGYAHSCAVVANGIVKCWGNNTYGQLGNNSFTASNTPVTVSGFDGLTPSSSARSVSVGGGAVCAVLVNGTVKCWGDNRYGQLGNNSNTNSSSPVSVSGITGLARSSIALTVSVENDHACALIADGTVRCWGRNDSGQLGDNSTADSLVPVSVSGIDGLAAASTAVSVSVGVFHTCALFADGSAWCWGKNQNGQLGDGTFTSSVSPVRVYGITGGSASSTAVSVIAGGYHTCALMADDALRCWGGDWGGQLGDDNTTDSPFPSSVSNISGGTPAQTAVNVVADEYVTCAVVADGTIRCWGSNYAGQLGDGTTVTNNVPVTVLGVDGSTANLTAITTSVGGDFACALMVDGSVTCWGNMGQPGGASFTGESEATRVLVTSVGHTLVQPVVASAPLHVVTANASSTSLDLSWTAPVFDGRAAITDYTIEYRKVGQMSWSTFTHAASISTSETVTGLDSDSSYVFRVAAVNSAGTGPWSQLESTVDAAEGHSCAVMAKGTVQCWGSNGSGQLGDNSTFTRYVPVLVSGISGLSPSDTAVSVTTGGSHSCALMANGTVRCWGWNFFGQLGNNTTTNALAPVSVSGISGATASTTAVSVSAGTWHTCAVMADGSVKCWGRNDAGELGDNTATDSSVPVLVFGLDGSLPSSLAVSVSAGRSYSCALLADGTVRCWGYSGAGGLGEGTNTSSSVPVPVSGVTGLSASTTAVSVSAGDYQTCAVMADGSVKCWGLNNWGQLGDSTLADKYVPTAVFGLDGSTAATSAASVSTGGSHTCAVMVDDSTYCWGDGRYGQLGDGSALGSSTSVDVSGIPGGTPSSNAVGVGIGQDYSCAVMADGTVQCWGNNAYGQLGNGTRTSQSAPVVVSNIDGNTTSTRVAASSPLSRGRTLGKTPSAPLHVVTSSPSLTALDVSWTEPVSVGGSPISDYTIEYRKVGGLSWTTVSHTASTATSITVTGLDSGSTYEFRVAAVNAGGRGSWNAQQIDVDAGGRNSCALMADGTVQCWGFNGDGQLGNNSNTNSLVPVSVTGITGVLPSSTAVDVSAGDSHACAVMADGTVQCWGLNWAGELGDNSTNNSSVPVRVWGITGLTAASTAVEVSVGYWHTCALMADGSVKCWGYNGDGALGDNSTNDSYVPVLVSGIDGATSAAVASGVSLAYWHSCASMANGTVQCWGKGADGRLGNNSTADSPVPVQVFGITGFSAASSAVSVSAGTAHTCAVIADGTVQCWGMGSEGRLGNNSTADSPVPVQVSGFTGLSTASTAVSVSSGGAHSCSVMGNGGVRCWGDNLYGRLGNNSTTSSTVPVQVSGFTGAIDANTVVTVTAGDGHTCSVMADRTVKCWGVNQAGQLGDNTTNSKSVPAPVTGIDGVATPSSARLSSSFGHTLDSQFVPSAPMYLSTTTASSSSLDLMWIPPISSGSAPITDYTIEYRQTGTSSWSTFSHTASDLTFATVSGLAPDTQYEFRVAAVNSVGQGPWSREDNVIDGGSSYSCAVMLSGAVQCWGWNIAGQLGNGLNTNSASPVLVSGFDGASSGTTAVSMSSGFQTSCAVTNDGTVKCWGAGLDGQLGNGTNANSNVPVLVSGLGTSLATAGIQVSVGRAAACALTFDGSVWCWGSNAHGELGDGTTTNSSVPVQVSGITGGTPATTAVSLSLGSSMMGGHACALMADGTVRCWGYNAQGTLGDGTTTDSHVPVLVSVFSDSTAATTAVSVSTGANASCSVMGDGTVRCWGANFSGQLGNGTTVNSSVPVPVSVITGVDATTTAVSVSTGDSATCALLVDGGLLCWGSNSSGQLGDGSITTSQLPVSVSGIEGVGETWFAASIGTGVFNSCAVIIDGTARCWGSNYAGALGDGTTTDSHVPVVVSDIDGQSAATAVRTSPFGRTLAPTLLIPSQPLHVVTSNATSTSIDVSWTAPVSDGGATISDYTIEYRKVGGVYWWGVPHTASTATSITAVGLDSDATYEFRVAAVNSVGTGSWSVQDSALVGGSDHSCVLMADGTVQCWGWNAYGQLGNNSTTDSLVPVPVSGITGTSPASTAVSIAAGYSHVCAVLGDGTVQCWGNNADGELGDNSSTDSAVPVSVVGITGSTPASTAVSVAANGAHTCALMADGTVQCWGWGGLGELGNNSNSSSSVPVSVSGITGLSADSTAVSVSAGPAHSCALMADATVKCWGNNHDGQLGNGSTTNSPVPVSVSGISGLSPDSSAVRVTSGTRHSCALMADATVKCWGGNGIGQLGNNSTTNSSVPVLVSGITGSWTIQSAVNVTAGDNHTCALMVEGSVRCWGEDLFGQLGDDSSLGHSMTPVTVSGISGLSAASTAISVNAGYQHSCVLMADATVRCWGNNGAGELGDGTTTERHAPVSVSGIDGLTDSSASAIPSFGRILAPVVPSTSGPSAPLYVQTSDATSHSVKVSWRVPVWNGGTPITNYKIQYRKFGVTTWKTFAHRASTSKSLIVSGLDSATTYEFRVAAVNSVGTGPWGVQESTAETGDSHTCAVTVNGKVKCWGWNAFGQLGDGSTTDSHVPVAVIGFTGSEESTTAVRVSAGGLHSCAVLVNGTVKCWGDNGSGQLGDGSTTPSSVPVLVSGITGQSRSNFAVNVTAGGGETCALMANGTVKCWGYNVDGQLGDGSNSDSSTPVVVQGIDGSSPSRTAVTVHTTGPQTCALMADGTVMCWGRNNYGQLGDDSNTSSNVPVVVSGIDGLSASSTAVSVAAGGYHSCAAMADGTVQCWGSNLHGALGDGQPMDSLVPVLVSGLDGSSASSSAVSVSAGSFHSCAVLADGTSACWGWNMNGTLGDGSLVDSSVPVWVSGLTGSSPASSASVVSAGGYHSCALMVDRSLQCWGYNVYGQLGDDSTVNRLGAVDVSGLDGSNSSRSVRQAATGTTLSESRPPKRPLLSRPTPVVVIDRDADSITIRWGVSADNGGKHIDSYRVSYRVQGSPKWTDSVAVRYSQLRLRVNGLKSGVKYEFQVRAHNANGLGDPSRIVSETVPVRAPAPIVVKKLWDHRVITLKWLAVQTPAHSPVTAYVMSCQVDDGETFRTRVGPDVLTASVKVPTTQLYSCRVAGVTDAGRGFGSERAFVSNRIQDGEQR